MAETEEIEVAMLCRENLEDSLGKEPHEETDDKEEKPDEEMQKPKDGEEHVNSTLHTGNQLKISIKQFSWGTEDDVSLLDTQETAQQELVYITNLKDDLQNNSTKMNEEKGPKDKKPAAKNRPFERTSIVNLNHGSKMYEESGRKMRTLKKTKRERMRRIQRNQPTLTLVAT